MSEFGSQDGTGAEGATGGGELDARIEPGFPEGRYSGKQQVAGFGQYLAEPGGEGGGQPMDGQAVPEQLQQGGAEAVGMGDADRRDHAVEFGETEGAVEAVGVGKNLGEGEKLAAPVPGAADGLFDQGRVGRGWGGWLAAFAVALDHLHRQVLEKAGEQGRGQTGGVAAGEMETAEHRAGFRFTGTRGAVEPGKGPGSAGLVQGGGIALGIEDFLPAVSKHLTLGAARRYSVGRGAAILPGRAVTASPGIRVPDFVVFYPVLSDSRIFVTGAGLVSPLGLDAAMHVQALREERQAFRPVTLFDVSRRVARTAGEVDLPSERLFARLPLRRQHLADRGTSMLLLALRETLASAGLAGMEGIDALVVGTSAGAMPLGQAYFREARRSPHRLAGQVTRVQFYQPWRQMRLIADEYDWRGPVRLVSNACASGANAIGEAMALIRSGRARRVLAGGYDALAELVFAGFDSLRALAPDGVPRPFDAARDGLALGEGAALVLLESAEAAAERGAEAWAEAAGYATTTDLHHLTQPDPQGRAAVRSMAGACTMAGLTPGEIGYLNSHGTGTPHNDVAEARAIQDWAGDAAAGIAVSSTKSAMGHLLGGAGAVEAVISLLALRGGWLPASLNVREADPAVGFDLVRRFREAPLRAVLTNSFGFGGTNASLVFRAADEAALRPAALRSPPILRVVGLGAVSPAGWGLTELEEAVRAGQSLPTQDCPRTAGPREGECLVRRVPPPPPERLLKAPRLRRASPVSRFALAAALEALERAGFPNGTGAGRLGLVFGMFNGCVQFSGRFYQEVLDTPELASPLLFPETVYNAPASHVAAQLGVDGPVSTLIGDAAVILDAVELAGLWLEQGLVERCLVLAAEECDWLGAEAVRYAHRGLVAGEGAAALLLSADGSGPVLAEVVDQPVRGRAERAQALAAAVRAWPGRVVIDGRCGVAKLDRDETAALEGIGGESRQPGVVLGECLGAAGSLQLVLAAAAAGRGRAAAAWVSGAQEAVRGVRLDP